MSDIFYVREDSHCSHSECAVPSKFWLQLTEEAFAFMGPFNTEEEAKNHLSMLLIECQEQRNACRTSPPIAK